eukprot:scaffold58013_cov67-Phaeocystis_antarctica.AAC.1
MLIYYRMSNHNIDTVAPLPVAAEPRLPLPFGSGHVLPLPLTGPPGPKAPRTIRITNRPTTIAKQPMQARLSATFGGAPPSSAAGGAAAAAAL